MSRNWIIAGVAALILGAILSRVIEAGVRVEKIMLTTNTPALRVFPATPGPHPIALLAHGNGGSKEMLFRFGEALAAAGFDCYSVDQAGYGQLPQSCSRRGDNSIGVQLGNADGTFGPLQTSSTGAGPRLLATGDFTGDNTTDVVTANSADVSLLKGNGDGTFAAFGTIALPGQIVAGNPNPGPLPQNPISIATGDLNGDGKLDLVVGGGTSFSVLQGCGYYGCYYQNVNDGYVNVLLGNGAGGFGPAEVHHLGTNRSPGAIAVGDINGDGKADVITGNSSGDLSVLLGDGTGAVGDPINSGSGSPLPSISLGDVDGDGKVDTLLGSGNGLGSRSAKWPLPHAPTLAHPAMS
jgi:hypothetical protein